MKKAGLLILLAAAAGLAAFSGFRAKPSGAAGQEYKPVQVEKGGIWLTVQATGTARPQNRLEIKPPISGRVEEVLIREGEPVKRGQVLAWMSSTERAALLDAARSQGSEAVAKWEQVYKPTPLMAPLDGTIIQRNVEPGQTVKDSDAVLVLSDRLIVQAQVDETDVGRVKLKQSATVALDAFPTQEVPAAVDHIAYEAKTVNNVTIYEVDVLPDEVPDFMRSGMTANVTFLVDGREGVLLVPAEAVEQGKAPFVLVSQNGKPVKREVVAGLTDGRMTEVVSGLALGESVLLKASPSFAPKKQSWSPFNPGARRPNNSGGNSGSRQR